MNSTQQFFKASNRSLLRELVASDFKLRYQGSVLGYLWSLLRPLMLFGVLYVVFTQVFNVGKDVPYFPSYLLLGIVLWTFFTESTMSGLNAITGRGDLVRKVSVPKHIIVISTTLSAFINFSLNLLVVIIFMIIGHVPFRASLVFVPLLIVELALLCLAVSFTLSALFVKFRDISHIWEVILQALFYATPILYPLTYPSSQTIRELLSINPLTQIIQDMRSITITPQTLTTKQVFNSQFLGRVWPVIFILVLAAISIWYFRRSSRNFAEEL
ncbi:ABC transporter permease [Candidatus Saccharibacteria bacterium]|nr:ABC transporter permease [Candidatus Saccharibacteria bacterium]